MRRRLVLKENVPNWDYELYNTDGIVPYLKVSVTAGQVITISYKAGTRGYIYDARPAGGDYKFAYQVEDTEGTIILSIVQAGSVSFAGHSTKGQTYEGDIFNGEYIKIRIE